MKHIFKTCIFLLILFPILILINGCDDFLSRETDSFIDKGMTFTSYDRASRFLVNAYSLLPDGFNRVDGDAMYDAATDDAEHANESSAIQMFNRGAWNAMTNPDNTWNRFYSGIRIANEFLENADNINLDRFKLDPNNQLEYQNRLKDIEIWKAEAHFLRAFFHFELLKRFGPIPLVTSILPIAEDHTGLSRPSMQQCIDFIVEECDTAAETLGTTPWRDATSALGRATKGAALALKSRVLLYAASPLYLDWENIDENHKPSDPVKWQKAAEAAKEVIDLNIYSLHASYSTLFQNNFENNEYIFMRRYGISSNFEIYNFPVSYGGRGGTNPSLNLVNAYEMKSGASFNWNDEANANHPHFSRDERLNATILLNDSVWKESKVQTWIGGKDGQYNTNATKTGYYLKKFLNEDVNLITGGGVLGHTWPFFRISEIYLNYAEALNEYDPDNADIAYYVNQVRRRANQPDLPSGLTQDGMRERIHNERRVELAFEEHRAWDVRRWKIAGNTLGSDLLGMEITRKQGVMGVANSVRANSSIEVPDGWYYYDGDEFNDPAIDNRYWGQYGTDTPAAQSQYGQPNGMAQTYRKNQVTMETSGGEQVARITATRDDNPPASSHAGAAEYAGWWSGALSSRDTDKYGHDGKYYPLFSRIEVRAKVPYVYGVWMAFWCRYYAGASIAELDIQEFFVKIWEDDDPRLSQALHLHDNETNSLATNVNGYGRHTVIDFDPMDDFHTYGVQVDPDPDDANHAIITFLLDGNPTSTFKTIDHGNKYNQFITKAKAEGREMTTWDIAITGQIGAPEFIGQWPHVGYPDQRNPDLRNVHCDIDWVRVFTREDLAPENPDPGPGPGPVVQEAFIYKPVVVENRVFEQKMYWYPIPLNEFMKMKDWDQNPGW